MRWDEMEWDGRKKKKEERKWECTLWQYIDIYIQE